MVKIMKVLVRIIVLIILGGINGYFLFLQGKSYRNVLVAFYIQLPVGLKESSFGEQLITCMGKRGKYSK